MPWQRTSEPKLSVLLPTIIITSIRLFQSLNILLKPAQMVRQRRKPAPDTTAATTRPKQPTAARSSSSSNEPTIMTTTEPATARQWSTRTQWIVFAIASGVCAAFNGAFAKLYVVVFLPLSLLLETRNSPLGTASLSPRPALTVSRSQKKTKRKKMAGQLRS